MSERAGRIATGILAVAAALIVVGGIWLANRSEQEAEAVPDFDRQAGETAPTTRPAETMLVVTLPTPITTTTTVEAATTTSTTSTTVAQTTTTEVPVPYRTAAEQIDYFTVGDGRADVIRDLQSLTPFMVSVDELSARHDQFGSVLIGTSGDGSAPVIRSMPAGIVVSMTSDFSGGDAIGEEAWLVTKYFAPLWAAGEPIRQMIETSEYGDRLDMVVGYGLEINIGRHSYQTSGPEMAAIADVRMSFADWERRAALEPFD